LGKRKKVSASKVVCPTGTIAEFVDIQPRSQESTEMALGTRLVDILLDFKLDALNGVKSGTKIDKSILRAPDRSTLYIACVYV
jgi:hypothetical protein